MYAVTQDFLDKMKANKRQVFAKCQIDYTDPFMDQSINITTSENANISYPSQAADAVTTVPHKWASLDGSWTLDGSYYLAPTQDLLSQYQFGWWGSQLSGADGSFVSPYPTLTVTHFARPIHTLTVVGDSARNEYPADFTIDLYAADGTKLYTKSVTGNTQVNWSYALPSPVLDVVKQVLTITKWNMANRQVKITEFFTSIQETYLNDDIVKIDLLEEREASQGSLPVGNISSNEVTLTLVNKDKKFNVDNTQSPLNNLLKPNRKIKLWLGIKGDGDGVNVQQTVDFNQGTLNNLVVVNNKLQLPSVAAPSFTRNSIAYKDDSTLVNTNLPRFEQGQFGNAIMIEEGTTNLAHDPNTDNAWWNAAPTSGILWGLSNDWSVTEQALKVCSYGSSHNGHSFYLDIQRDVWFTLSAKIKNVKNALYPLFFLALYNSAGTCIQTNYIPEILAQYNWAGHNTPDYAEAWITYRIPSGVYMDAVKYTVQLVGTGNSESEIYLKDIQLEQKPYRTTWCPYNSTRSPETLTIPTTGVLNPQEGTIDIWFYYNPCGIWQRLVSFVASGVILNGYTDLQFDISPTGYVRFQPYPLGGSVISVTAVSPIQGGWHFASCKWSSSGISLVVDNQSPVTNTYSGGIATLDTTFTIGSEHNFNQNYLNSYIDDLRISSRARTDEEIAQAYASGQPLPVDEWTTYKLGFDGNLNFGQGGSYISPEYVLSAVGTAATSAISWTEDADGIQRTVYAKLDNQADWTQLQNGGKLPINAGDVLTDRTLQLKTKLLKVV